MQERWYGGNQVWNVANNNQTHATLIQFSEKMFDYFLVSLSPGTRFTINHLAAYTVFFLRGAPNTKVFIDKHNEQLTVGDSLDSNDMSVELFVEQGNAEILVSGVKTSAPHSPSLRVVRKGQHYQVFKPWGHELWVNGEHSAYSFKEVFIRQGHRTSLQYHNIKSETNMLAVGTARLVYKENSAVSNDEVAAHDLGVVELRALSILNVVPGILHRIEAVTDILLYETSTPHLDDVIRVSDDHARGNGRIVMEHGV